MRKTLNLSDISVDLSAYYIATSNGIFMEISADIHIYILYRCINIHNPNS